MRLDDEEEIAKLRERVLSKVSINQVTGCWLWTGSTNPCGYGRLRVDATRSMLVHRFVAEHIKGEQVEGLQVLHACDNRRCCNPDHLSVGTHEDNSADMRERKSYARGERHGGSKLHTDEVLAIRALHRRHPKDREFSGFLARWFGVAKSTVNDILRHATWKHVHEPDP